MTSLDLTTELEIVASEETPRSSMATVLGVGVGVAAAAFFVRPLSTPSVASHVLTRLRRGERAYWHSESIAVEQPAHALWVRLTTKVASSLG